MAKKQDNSINISPVVVTPAKYSVGILGTASLLMDKKSDDFGIPKADRPNQAQVDLTRLEWESWREKLYCDPAGQVYIPSECLHASLLQGASYWGAKIPRTTRTYPDLIKCGLVVEDLFLGITKDDEDKIKPYGTTVNGSPSKSKGSSTVFKVRPQIPVWGGNFQIEVLEGRLDAGVLRTIITFAGMFKGVGNYRPKFGRYILTELTKI